VNIAKAVITAAGRSQRTLPTQIVIDRDGGEKSVLRIIVEEVLRTGVEEICVVVCPGDEQAYASAVGDHAGRLHFVQQKEPDGYGHALHCSHQFVGDDPFLHLVGDHLYVSQDVRGCAKQVVDVASAENCAVSAVQSTHEAHLPYYGTVGGSRLHERPDLYRVDRVLEKPTPTEAEQQLVVPGLRTGHYLCLFGIHVFTPTILSILGEQIATGGVAILSEAMTRLATREQYVATATKGRRYDVGVKYGLLTAQLALGLDGVDRDQVLTHLLELLALRELGADSTRQDI